MKIINVSDNKIIMIINSSENIKEPSGNFPQVTRMIEFLHNPIDFPDIDLKDIYNRGYHRIVSTSMLSLNGRNTYVIVFSR